MCDTINNGLIFNNKYYTPPEILSLILGQVDVKTLYTSCTLVCKEWNAIIRECVCKLKCEQVIMNDDNCKYKLQLLRQKHYTYIVYQTISVLQQQFYTNLIKNPCGMDGFNHWMIDKNHTNNFTIGDCTLFDENVCKMNDEMVANNIIKCFTSNEPWGKIQVIDLYKQGLTPQFIDEYQPPIYISEWYGSRRDTETCSYKLCVLLFDADYKEINRCNCQYKFECFFEQGECGFFQKVQHVFKNYGKNVRYVFYWHSGMDFSTFSIWLFSNLVREDYYSIKFTNANVQLFYPNDTHYDHVIDEHSQQTYHKLCKKYCKFLYTSIPDYAVVKYKYKNECLD